MTKASHTATSNFKALGKHNLTLYLEGEEGKYLLEAPSNYVVQHWQELGEMDTRRPPGSSANWQTL